MKRIILYFLIILASIWLGVQVYQHPGYILVMYQKWAIETTTWFLVLILLLAFLIFHFLLNLIKQALVLPSRVEHWWSDRRLRKSMSWLNQGYGELISGRFKKAEKFLIKSAKKKELAFINYLLAAEAADAQQDHAKREKYLQSAQSFNKNNPTIIDTLRVDFLLGNNQLEEALALLTKLRQIRPKDPHILQLLTETYLMLGEYSPLLSLLPDIKKSKIFVETTFAEMERDTYLHALRDRVFTDFSEIQSLWKKMPKPLRHEPQMLIAYANHLRRWDRGGEIEDLLRKELKGHYDHNLMAYYATVKSEQPAKQLALAEKWLKSHSDDPATLKAMGQLCLRNRLWGQARDYFEASLKIHSQPETYSTLGYVYERLGDSEKALRYYRKGLKNLLPFSH